MIKSAIASLSPHKFNALFTPAQAICHSVVPAPGIVGALPASNMSVRLCVRVAETIFTLLTIFTLPMSVFAGDPLFSSQAVDADVVLAN